MLCEERFYEIYGRDYDGVAFCPYRICPIGAHSDHNFGKITGLAIDKGIHIAYSAKQNGGLWKNDLLISIFARTCVPCVPSPKNRSFPIP